VTLSFKVGDMVCITELAPGEEGQGLTVGSVHRLRAVAAVRMDGWLRLCFRNEAGETIGGMGGLWCRARAVKIRERVVTLEHSGWGPQ